MGEDGSSDEKNRENSRPDPFALSTSIIPPTGPEHVLESADFDVEVPIPSFDRYELIGEIARGGQGIIYRASDHVLPREVAIKILHPSHRHNERYIRGLANEARVMSYLSHPNITPVHECGVSQDDRPYYVMNYVNGQTLAELLKHETPLSSITLNVFSDVCQAIAFAHSRGVIHLDLKPQNVMVGPFGEVHVMDWGLARFAKEYPSAFANYAWKPALAHASEVNGTLSYMSPEQARGDRLDERTDVFGLGGILCEIILGHAPYQGDNVKKMFEAVRSGAIAPTLSSLETSDTDRWLVRLAKRCLSFHPDDRPVNAIEVVNEIAEYHTSALQRAESDMNRFFELSLDLFCIAGLDGFFRRINQNFSRVLGYSERELLSRPFLDFVHKDDRETTVDQMSVLGKGQPVVRFRNRYTTVQGGIVTLEWMAKSIAGEELIFAVARDVSAVDADSAYSQ